MLPVICLMGPTAAGKTALAVELVQQFPCEIISVDSAMVYRGMDIGTAKPDQTILQRAPHRLINCRDPKEPYSAGQFCIDALHEIKEIHAHANIPLLVGGTMLYFRALQQGLAKLPLADVSLREVLQVRAQQEGWEALHAQLEKVDPLAASRIHVSDGQRIQRALEVYHLTGTPISVWQAEETSTLAAYDFHSLVLMPFDRARLHERIAVRFYQMLEQGFVAEVEQLHKRGDLHPNLPSIRSVGYKQVWAYLEGEITYEQMCDQAIAATRQLAKRQMTWLRSWPNTNILEAEADSVFSKAQAWMRRFSS